jgi:hypothetical protein
MNVAPMTFKSDNHYSPNCINDELHGLYCWGDYTKEDEVGGTCSTHVKGRSVYRILVGRPRRRWEDNIQMDLRVIGIDGANWIRLSRDRVQRRAFVNMAMNLRVP